MVFAFLAFASPSHPNLLSTCRVLEKSLVHLKLDFAVSHQSCSHHGIQVGLCKPPGLQQDLQTTMMQAILRLTASGIWPTTLIFQLLFDILGILAFRHVVSSPKQPFQAQNLPQDALLDPPRRAKAGPSWPKMGPNKHKTQRGMLPR